MSITLPEPICNHQDILEGDTLWLEVLQIIRGSRVVDKVITFKTQVHKTTDPGLLAPITGPLVDEGILKSGDQIRLGIKRIGRREELDKK